MTRTIHSIHLVRIYNVNFELILRYDIYIIDHAFLNYFTRNYLSPRMNFDLLIFDEEVYAVRIPSLYSFSMSAREYASKRKILSGF